MCFRAGIGFESLNFGSGVLLLAGLFSTGFNGSVYYVLN